MPASPQSSVPRYNPKGKLSIHFPIVVNQASADALEVFNVNDFSQYNFARIRIQNQGTDPILLAFNQPAEADKFHRTIKAGTANDDGEGGIEIVDKLMGVETISLKVASGTLRASVEILFEAKH